MPDRFGMYRYFTVYKPYGVLSQFTPDHPGQRTLEELGPFPKDVYPVGRLDADSEGLVILTNDNLLKTKVLDPDSKIEKIYWAQVEGEPVAGSLVAIHEGMSIRVKGKLFKTAPAYAEFMDETPVLPNRRPPVRFRQSIPDCWVQFILTEGKNRQVRKMLAAVGFPVLRLVRYAIGGLTLVGNLPGDVREWDGEALYQLIFKEKT